MNLFDKIATKLNYLDEEAESYFDVSSTVKEIEALINKVKVRYERYEAALKDIASYEHRDNYSLSLKQDFCRLAKEVLVSDEEIQIKQLKEILADFDKDVIIEVLKDLI